MALFKKFKYVFGLSPDDEDDDLIADDPETETNVKRGSGKSVVSHHIQARPTVNVDIEDDDATSAIFEHVVEIFNKSLPDFLKQSVDPSAERKVLYDSLSDDLKRYLSTIAERTQQQCQESWTADKQRLQENVRELEEKTKSFEAQREEMSQKQLSVERQRRALSDRVHDLEKQVMSFEAEREQFQLENKSLVNKLKVASVTEKDIDAMRDEINRLQEELNNVRQQSILGETDAEPTPDRSEEIKALEAKVAEYETKIADANAKIEETNAKLREANDKEIKANEELEILRTKVSDADAVNKELSEIENQIVQFEQIKAKKDARINDLTLELAKATEKVKDLEDAAAKSAGEQKQLERKLQSEIERLKDALAEAQKKAEAEPKEREKRSKSVGGAPRNRVEQNTHIDDILSDTDWLVSPSSLKSNKNGQTASTTNHSNGQSRQEKNDAQMTLF